MWRRGSHPVREMVTYVTANFFAADVGIEFLRRHIPESVTPGYGGSGGVPLLNPSPKEILIHFGGLCTVSTTVVREMVTYVTARNLAATSAVKNLLRT
jgi:hypothetical protein